jgi:hypothetical protein
VKRNQLVLIDITLNIDRLWGRVQKIAEFTLASEFKNAGLEVSLDGGGNMVGRLAGTRIRWKSSTFRGDVGAGAGSNRRSFAAAQVPFKSARQYGRAR